MYTCAYGYTVTAEKFEQISHCKLDLVEIGNYKGPEGNSIEYKQKYKIR